MGQELSVLLPILPGGEPPSAEEAAARLQPFYRAVPAADGAESADGADGPGVGEDGEGGEGGDRTKARWAQGWRSPEGDEHLVSLGPFDPGWVEVPLAVARLSEPQARAARRARWALWCTTRLDAGDPLAAYARQLRFAAIAAPDAVAVHDHASQRTQSADRLRAVSSWATPPPPTELYAVHAVSPRSRWGTAWVHTHGLARCGMPDVELLRVPTHLAEAARDLLAAFVRARLGTPVALRGFSDDLVLGHRVEWLPSEEAVRRMTPRELGGRGDRRRAPSHAGRRIAIVAADRPDRPPDPPLDLLEAFDEATAVVRVRPSESERAARLARERWPVFERLFGVHGDDDDWSFVVSVPLPTASGGSEHLWWLVERIRDGRLLCRVRNEVIDVPGLATDDLRWHDVSAVDDWVVYAPRHDVTPATVSP
jgi:hypothetical protein